MSLKSVNAIKIVQIFERMLLSNVFIFNAYFKLGNFGILYHKLKFQKNKPSEKTSIKALLLIFTVRYNTHKTTVYKP